MNIKLSTFNNSNFNKGAGKLKWFYQQVPHDVWGYDVASPPVLFDYKKDGISTLKYELVGEEILTPWAKMINIKL